MPPKPPLPPEVLLALGIVACGPCLDMAVCLSAIETGETETGPCLDFPQDSDSGTPCLDVVDSGDSGDSGDSADTGDAARAAVVERVVANGVLPPDVARRLRCPTE